MRKTVIALIMVLPICFVLILFSSVNLVSLNVNIPVGSIKIVADTDDDFLVIDMADTSPHVVSAKVSPSNATEQGYLLSSADPSVLEVGSDGRLIGKREGSTSVVATSKDKSFTDAIGVSVISSKPYDLDFSLFDFGGDEDHLVKTDDGYSATLFTGSYMYKAAVHPSGFAYHITTDDNTFAQVDEARNSISLPFSGRASFTVTVKDGVENKDITKKIRLDVRAPQSDDRNAILINGNLGGNLVLMARGEMNTSFFVQCNMAPRFVSDSAVGEVIGLGGNRYRVDVTIGDGVTDDFTASVICGDSQADIEFQFSEYDFYISATGIRMAQNDDDEYVAAVLENQKDTTVFYAVSVVNKTDIEYRWEAPEGFISYSGDKCNLTPSASGTFKLKVSAVSGGQIIKENIVGISVVEKVTGITITNKLDADLALNRVVGGHKYDESGELVENEYKLNIYVFASNITNNLDDVAMSVSDESKAEIRIKDGAAYLVPKASGKVRFTAEWKWNSNFMDSISVWCELAIAMDAVEVSNAPDLIKATDEGKEVVLTGDIMLGTDRSGAVFSLEARKQMIKRTKSTYNIEWYKQSDKAGEAYVSFVMEFKNNVYGNGYFINADYLTHCEDSTGKPLIDSYKDPLYFVNFNDSAVVSAQDNCAFLIRTDDVTLYGVKLLGCSDSSLLDGGAVNLVKLNHVGTTLEINADNVNVLNCRISNGRNVVRVYGGNRDGEKYFIDSLAENANGVKNERINVRIEGCIISQGREFLLKVGANRALRASVQNGQQPELKDQKGNAYKATGKKTSNVYENLYNDPYFYDNYVMTDVTLKDSVLETSGLFSIGVESNFSGDLLYKGVKNETYRNATKLWQMSGGTSFASVLRLEGDVRLYDWKDLSHVDSSTLIEAKSELFSEWLNLNIKSMFDFVNGAYPDKYGNLIESSGDKKFVHGGIAYYGGGLNYSQLVTDDLNENLKDLVRYTLNISVLADSPDVNIKKQGQLLPLAAGTNDFNFFMYGKESANNYTAQLNALSDGIKYNGIVKLPLFD